MESSSSASTSSTSSPPPLTSSSVKETPSDNDTGPAPTSSEPASSSSKSSAKDLEKAICDCAKAANALPTPKDIAFHRTLDRSFARRLDDSSTKILSLLNKLSNAGSASLPQSAPFDDFEDVSDVMDSYPKAVAVVDNMLERSEKWASNPTQEMSSKPTVSTPEPISSNQLDKTKERLPKELNIFNTSNIPKPQNDFIKKPDNQRGLVWKPFLEPNSLSINQKYNAIEPFILTPTTIKNPMEGTIYDSYEHPYGKEINTLINGDLPKVYTKPLSISPNNDKVPTFEGKPFQLITNVNDFNLMLNHLKSVDEIAVDLEHNDYRSYYGLTCLMQISTRQRDFIVDVLVPEIRNVAISLNIVFTDPNIVKIFHGSDSDVIWLQRDLGLYLVNLFDTFHATKILSFSAHSLSSLLKKYCDYTADKRYQRADWRLRPIPSPMLDYARSDTLFLIYIYDRLIEALVTQAQSQKMHKHSLISQVLHLSAQVCLKTYTHEPYDFISGTGSRGWRTMARRSMKKHGPRVKKSSLLQSSTSPGERDNSNMDNAPTNVWFINLAMGALEPGQGDKFIILRAIHDWRDQVAREEDESLHFVLPDASLINIANNYDTVKPAGRGGIFKYCYPVSAPIQRRWSEIVPAVEKALEIHHDAQQKGLVVIDSQGTMATNEQLEKIIKPRKDLVAEFDRSKEKNKKPVDDSNTNQSAPDENVENVANVENDNVKKNTVSSSIIPSITTPSSSMWNDIPQSSVISVASSSSLFGGTLVKPSESGVSSTSHSSLFSQSANFTTTTSQTVGRINSSFLDSSIGKTMVPNVTAANIVKQQPTGKSSTPTPSSSSVPMDVDPAPIAVNIIEEKAEQKDEKQTPSPPLSFKESKPKDDKNEIVQVKKRKKPAKEDSSPKRLRSEQGSNEKKNNKKGKQPLIVEPFDYSSNKKLLDGADDADADDHDIEKEKVQQRQGQSNSRLNTPVAVALPVPASTQDPPSSSSTATNNSKKKKDKAKEPARTSSVDTDSSAPNNSDDKAQLNQQQQQKVKGPFRLAPGSSLNPVPPPQTPIIPSTASTINTSSKSHDNDAGSSSTSTKKSAKLVGPFHLPGQKPPATTNQQQTKIKGPFFIPQSHFLTLTKLSSSSSPSTSRPRPKKESESVSKAHNSSSDPTTAAAAAAAAPSAASKNEKKKKKKSKSKKESKDKAVKDAKKKQSKKSKPAAASTSSSTVIRPSKKLGSRSVTFS